MPCCCLEFHIKRVGVNSLEYYTATENGTYNGYCTWTFDILIEETVTTLYVWSNDPKSWLITTALGSASNQVFVGTDTELPECPTTTNLPSGWEIGGLYVGEFQTIKAFECATDSACDCLNGTITFSLPE